MEDGRLDYRELNLVKIVQKNQLLAAKFPPKEGKSGKNLLGDVLPAQKGDEVKFEALNNIKKVKSKNKELYYSAIEGRVVLVGDSGISVNQVFEVKGNIDYSTGNIDFNGDVQIAGSVQPGFKVKAGGNITVNGMVNQGVNLSANGNIIVKQGIIGKKHDTKLFASGNIHAQYIQHVDLYSEMDIVVKDYIMNCNAKAKGFIITPDKDKSSKGKGSIVGGELTAIKGIIANTIGSEFTKNTKLTVGVDFDIDKKLQKLDKGIDYCEKEIAKLSKFLKLGFMDLETLKEKIAKIPSDKQKPFLEAIKKLDEINHFKSAITDKRGKMIKESDNLSAKSEVIVKKELFTGVGIQIGKTRILSEHLTSETKITESKDRNSVEYSKISSK